MSRVQIAVYGKGGIGKSTVSANLSAALASLGNHVIQIGCDPKHDSTRLLCHGQAAQTVLDYLLETPVDAQRVGDVLTRGFHGVACMEAGGPRPGTGCAGRGILTAFEFLERQRALESFDTVIYDVLGDVVCGGFAVPVRPRFANMVFLVTSGEAMALYAANNILKGIQNLSGDAERVAGIVFNSRGEADEGAHVEAFARSVGLPVCARIPRSRAFAEAERAAETLEEQNADSAEAGVFLALARHIREGMPLYAAHPLDDEQMERFMRGETPASVSVKQKRAEPSLEAAQKEEKSFVPVGKRALNDPFSRVPLFGCAFNGATALAIHVRDAAVLCHSPKSCIWFSNNGFTGYSRRGLYERGIVYPAFIPRHVEATDIVMGDAVYGGVAHAREKALELARSGAKAIIAVTSCIPGMSGDDLSPVKAELAAMGCEMIIVPADGVEAGDYDDGMALCYRVLAREAVRRGVPVDPNAVNLVFEHTISARTDQNYETVREMLTALGLHVNCRFVCATSIGDIHNFLAAPYSVMARDNALGRELKALFETEYGCKFLPGTLPKGFSETAKWVEALGEAYDRREQGAALIEAQQKGYRTAIEALKPVYQGQRALISLNNNGCEWVLELAEDLGLDLVKVFLKGDRTDGNIGWNRRFSADFDGDRESLARAIDALKPELLLTNDFGLLSDTPEGVHVINVSRDQSVGFMAGIEAATRWTRLLTRGLEGGWKRDRQLFEKYYG